jgi:hypothetical protein
MFQNQKNIRALYKTALVSTLPASFMTRRYGRAKHPVTSLLIIIIIIYLLQLGLHPVAVVLTLHNYNKIHTKWDVTAKLLELVFGKSKIIIWAHRSTTIMFRGFPHYLEANAGAAQTRPRPLPSTSFSAHYSQLPPIRHCSWKGIVK